MATWAADRVCSWRRMPAQALGSSWATPRQGLRVTRALFVPLHARTSMPHSGGALYLNDPTVIENATYVWERGTNRQAFLRGAVDRYTWMEVGSSFQGTEIQATLLLAGLEEFDEITEARRLVWDVYTSRPPDWRSAAFTPATPARGRQLTTDTSCAEWAAETDALRLEMSEKGIHMYSHYVPLHDSPLGIASVSIAHCQTRRGGRLPAAPPPPYGHGHAMPTGRRRDHRLARQPLVA